MVGLRVTFSEAMFGTVAGTSLTRATATPTGFGTSTLTWTFTIPVTSGSVAAAVTNALTDSDVAMMAAAIRNGSLDPYFELTGDGLVTAADLAVVRSRIGR